MLLTCPVFHPEMDQAAWDELTPNRTIPEQTEAVEKEREVAVIDANTGAVRLQKQLVRVGVAVVAPRRRGRAKPPHGETQL